MANAHVLRYLFFKMGGIDESSCNASEDFELLETLIKRPQPAFAANGGLYPKASEMAEALSSYMRKHDEAADLIGRLLRRACGLALGSCHPCESHRNEKRGANWQI